MESFKELKEYIREDIGYTNGKVVRTFFRRYFLEAGFKYVFWLRMTRYLWFKHSVFYFFSKIILKHYSYKFSFDISHRAQIGPGLQISHFGYIVVTSKTVIGSHCTLRPGVVFGKKLNERTKGAIIGDYVDFGVGSKVIGAVEIGDHVIVGANAVITRNVPSNVIVAGIPAKVIRYREKHE